MTIALAAIVVIVLVHLHLGDKLVWGETAPKEAGEAAYNAEALLYRVATVVILALFIPYTALSFIVSRRRVRKRELEDICEVLGLDFNRYDEIYRRETKDVHFLYSVSFTFVVTTLGLFAAILGDELALDQGANILLGGSLVEVGAGGSGRNGQTASAQVHQTVSLMFFGMGFLGAYLWGLQNILRRYFSNDLVPGVYYSLGVRMIFAAIISLLFYHLIAGISDLKYVDGSPTNDLAVLPVLAFVIGFFPQRALQYITEKFNLFSKTENTSAPQLTLDVIQGVSATDKLRLREEGISSAYDLAQAEFTKLLFTSPFGPAQLIDWILQAKLCTLFRENVEALREHSIRTVSDLKFLSDEEAQSLAEEAKVTKNALGAARKRAQIDPSTQRLERLRELLGDAGPSETP